MKLFKNSKSILGEIQSMEKADADRREDRATVSDFFNGAPPISDEEAEELGFTVNVNHLFGYADIAEASNQMLSLYTKPTHFFGIEIDTAKPGKAIEWSMGAQTEAARVLKKIKPFRTHFQGVCGDCSLHGEGILHFTSRTFPTPRHAPLSKFLVPQTASTDPSELSHFAREGSIDLKTLHRIKRFSPPGWKMTTVNRLLAKLYEGDEGMTEGALTGTNLEELEYRRQENSATETYRKVAWGVYYFYQRRWDLTGEPIGLTIICKDTEDNRDPDDKNADMVIYEGESCYDSINSLLHPLFMDCVIGGEMKWHRVLGLGTLNYSVNQAVELLICRAQQATMEGSMSLWKANNATDREAIQQILLKHNGVIPEGLEMVNERFKPDYTGMLQMIQFYRQQGSKNSRGVTPNNGGANDQLEVQAQFEQNQAASISNNRSALAYDYLDPMWAEVFARLTNPFIEPGDDGYSEVMDFQNAIARRGIPLYYLQPHNVTVSATRIVGDGLRSKELAIAAHLSTTRNNHPPEVQGEIGRIIDGAVMDNQALAERLNPIQKETDVPQEMRAKTENAIMLAEREPQTPKADDVDALHVTQHFPAMELMIKDGLQYQKGAFTPPQAEAFKVLGGHIAMHIHRIEGQAANNKNDQNRVMARQFMDQLNQMAAMGDKLAHNMQQMQGADDKKEMDPAEMAHLKLEMEKLEFNRHKLALNTHLKDRQLHGREQAEAFRQQMQLEKDYRESQAHRQALALNDVGAALDVKAAHEPKPAAAK